MYICYCDESGYNGKKFNPNQPIMVMIGILTNLYHYHKSNIELNKLLHIIKHDILLREIKAHDLYRGTGNWRGIDSDKRDLVIEFYLTWLKERGHKIIVSAVDNKSYFDLLESNEASTYTDKLISPYVFSVVHIVVVIQKINRSQQKNKGKTLLICDEEPEFENIVAEIIYDPPDFIDEFVDFDNKNEKYRLNQIVDTTYFVKSHHSVLAQAADIVAFFVRLYIELNSYQKSDSYTGEINKINAWIEIIKPCLVELSKIYPRKNTNFVNFINKVKAKGT